MRTRYATPFPMLVGLMLVGILLSACSEPESVTPAPKRGKSAVLVETVTLTPESLAKRVLRTGTLRAQETINIVTQEEGRITQLPFYVGDKVRPGDTLYAIDDTLLSAELNKAVAQRKQAEEDLRRNTTLQKKGVVSEDELIRARTALDVARAEEALLRTRLGYTRIEAPRAGVITQRLAEPGDIAQRFTHLLTLINPDVLLTDVSVSELLLPELAVGAQVSVTIDALGNTPHIGTIKRIHPTVDPISRQGTVEVALQPPPAGAMPGQLCRVTLSGAQRSRLLIPFSTLRSDAQGEYVYRIDAEDKAQRAGVVTGEFFNDQVEVVDGLAGGERIVIRGFFDLHPGAKTRSQSAMDAGQ